MRFFFFFSFLRAILEYFCLGYFGAGKFDSPSTPLPQAPSASVFRLLRELTAKEG